MAKGKQVVKKRQSDVGTAKRREILPRKMSKDPLKGRVRRQEVFDAIAKAMAKRRLGMITLDEIASLIDGSKGTIYYYFKSKGDMLYQMQMYLFELVGEAVTPIMQDKAIPPRERLERVVRSHTMVLCDHWQLARALRMDLDMALKEAPSGLRRVIVRRRNSYAREVTKLVEEVAEAEGWSCIEPETVSRSVLGTIATISRWYRKSGKLSAEEVADYAVRCVFDGFFDKPRG